MYLQIPCQTLSVICMEIERRVKLSENVDNIWISARKPVVGPRTRYCTRRNIVLEERHEDSFRFLCI